MTQRLLLYLLWLLSFLPVAGMDCNSPEDTLSALQFPSQWLHTPRQHADSLLKVFDYKEVELQYPEARENLIFLENGYASARILNPGALSYDTGQYRVARVEIVYTLYPLHKHLWLTNYYELLAWRLKALFALDSSLNSTEISWGRILQTAGRTDSEARKLWHGIVLTLEPLEQIEEMSSPPVTEISDPPFYPGYVLPPEDRGHDFFRSRTAPEPLPGREPRRNMDPRKLKCPRWR